MTYHWDPFEVEEALIIITVGQQTQTETTSANPDAWLPLHMACTFSVTLCGTTHLPAHFAFSTLASSPPNPRP